VVFTATWVPAVLVVGGTSCGTSACDNFVGRIWVPVAGPLLAAGAYDNRNIALLALWSGAQALGVTLIIIGIASHDPPSDRPAPPNKCVGPTLSLTPSGLMLHATF